MLRFLRSPVEIRGNGRVEAIDVRRNEIVRADDGALRARPLDEEVETIECGLVLRSVGYRAVPLPDVPFDERHFVLPNERGRVLAPDGETLPGVYAVGWIKRGPTGILGTNKRDAEETVQLPRRGPARAARCRSRRTRTASRSTRCSPSASRTSSRSRAGGRSTATSASADAASSARASSSRRAKSCSPPRRAKLAGGSPVASPTDGRPRARLRRLRNPRGLALGRHRGVSRERGRGDPDELADAWRARYRPILAEVNEGSRPWGDFDELHLVTLEDLLAERGVELSVEERQRLVGAWHRLDAWPDVRAGLEALRRRRVAAALSNGHVALLVDLARHADLRFDCVLSAELAHAYKPAPEVYRTAARLLASSPPS